jgi:hypothetical protein
MEAHPFFTSFLLFVSRGWNNKKVKGIMNMDAMSFTIVNYKYLAGNAIRWMSGKR